MSEKSTRNDLESRQFPQWNDITPPFIRISFGGAAWPWGNRPRPVQCEQGGFPKGRFLFMSLPDNLSMVQSTPIGKFAYRESVILPFPPLPMVHKRKSDLAVVTWVAGDAAYKWFSVTGPAMRRYAEKVKADFVVIEGFAGQPYSLSNKFRVRQVIEQYGYEAVLFVDADALIRDHCVNFFELVPANQFAILEETPYYDEWMLAYYRREASALLQSQGYEVDYLSIPSPKNSGLFLIPAAYKEVLTPLEKPFPLCWRNGAAVEQTWLSLMLRQYKTPLFLLKHPEQHWMWYADQKEKDTDGAMVLHFAGLWGEGDRRYRRLVHYASRSEVRPNSSVGRLSLTAAVNIPSLDLQMMIDPPAPAALNMHRAYTIDTHRYGWKVAIKSLAFLANPDGVLFDGFVEDTFLSQPAKNREAKVIPYREPWVGFIHHPPGVPNWPSIAKSRIQNLSQNPDWLESLPHCLGLFAMTEYLATWARNEWKVPCDVVRYPTLVPDEMFSIDKYEAESVKILVTIGFWLRRLTSFSMLRADGFRKVRPILMTDQNTVGMSRIRAYEKEEAQSSQFNWNNVQPVELLPRLSDVAYDDLLSKSVAFLNLIDASAVTTIVECMVRGTPLLVNRIPPVIEYLGSDYPFYFDTLEEAATKLSDSTTVRAAHRHMQSNPMVKQLAPQAFLNSFAETRIYEKVLATASSRTY